MRNSFFEEAREICKKCNIKFTEQRQIIAKVIHESSDHPDVEQIFVRSVELDKNINLATVYRTTNLFEHLGILKKHYFGDNRARYEPSGDIHHDHIIDISSNTVIEFTNSALEKTIKQIASVMDYEVVNYNLEIYGMKKQNSVIQKLQIIEEELIG